MGYDYHLYISVFIFLLTVVMMFWGKFSMASVSVASMMLFVFTGCLDSAAALSGFANSATIIIASMYIISEAFSHTKLPKKIFNQSI